MYAQYAGARNRVFSVSARVVYALCTVSGALEVFYVMRYINSRFTNVRKY